jgi:hypothetical protein
MRQRACPRAGRGPGRRPSPDRSATRPRHPVVSCTVMAVSTDKRMAAEAGQGQDIGLDAGTTRRIGGGKTEDGRRCGGGRSGSEVIGRESVPARVDVEWEILADGPSPSGSLRCRRRNRGALPVTAGNLLDLHKIATGGLGTDGICAKSAFQEQKSKYDYNLQCLAEEI